MHRYENLARLFDRADEMDILDGSYAYSRYHDVMRQIAGYYDHTLDRVVGAFVALSPNSDYFGNLRSLISMLYAKKLGHEYDAGVVSTYKHCRERARLYLEGTPFLEHAKGPKTRAFYENILSPNTAGPVTVDGHMYWAWMGDHGTMKEAKVTNRIYKEISFDIRKLSLEVGLRPHEVQAILWFARKREQGVKYSPQLDLFDVDVGFQKTSFKIEELRPYGIEQ